MASRRADGPRLNTRSSCKVRARPSHLNSGLKKFGKNWKRVEAFIGTRTGTQIRSHAQKFFNRIRKEFRTEEPAVYVRNNLIRTTSDPDFGADISGADYESEPDTTPLFRVVKVARREEEVKPCVQVRKPTAMRPAASAGPPEFAPPSQSMAEAKLT